MSLELGGKTSKKFDELCKKSDDYREEHLRLANVCGKHKNFHSVTVIIINIFASSVLFLSLADLAPIIMKWFAAILVLLSSSCAALNTYFRYPERESHHEIASKRYEAFMYTCQTTVAKYKDGRIDETTFDKLLDHHLEEYKSIINDSPRIKKNTGETH